MVEQVEVGAVVVAGAEEDVVAAADDGHVVRALGVVVEAAVDRPGDDALVALLHGVVRETVEVALAACSVYWLDPEPEPADRAPPPQAMAERDSRPRASRFMDIRSSCESELEAFAQGPWGEKLPTVAAAWRRAWDRVIPFFAFSPAIRRVIYTTNAIESINARLRKIIKTRGHFPSDDAATKLIWLALRNITADWGRAAKDWKDAINQFAILYAERFEAARG